jgi:hypothetical protein
MLNPDHEIELAGLPTYDDLLKHGVGAFLHGPNGEPPAQGVPPQDASSLP